MKFTPAFVAAFVAMTWSQEAEGFGDKLQVRPTFPNPMRPNRNMFDDDLGGGSFFVEGGVNGGGQNGNPKWDGKIRYERTWDDQDEDLGGPYKRPPTFPNPMRPNRNMLYGGGNGRPEWNGRIGFENEWDEDDSLGAASKPKKMKNHEAPKKLAADKTVEEVSEATDKNVAGAVKTVVDKDKQASGDALKIAGAGVGIVAVVAGIAGIIVKKRKDAQKKAFDIEYVLPESVDIHHNCKSRSMSESAAAYAPPPKDYRSCRTQKLCPQREHLQKWSVHFHGTTHSIFHHAATTVHTRIIIL